MFDASGLDQYLRIGRSAVYAISQAIMLTGQTDCRRVLDLPCGFGRVLRHLIAFFPGSHFVACDLNKGAVDYCRQTFNVEGVYGQDRFDYDFDSPFDLIWCGSLLTHLPEQKFQDATAFLVRNLAEEGVAVITLHGRFSLTVHDTYSKLLPNDQFLQVKRDFLTNGFGYRDYDDSKGMGYGSV
jgi:SAM-dependent methyltransferase